jgi:hypothetical protein
MRNHVVFDSVVDFAVQNALVDQVLLGAIRSEANNASGPTARHAGDFQQLIHSRMINVDPRLRRRRRCGCFRSLVGIAILVLRSRQQANAQDCDRQDREFSASSHRSILCLARAGCKQTFDSRWCFHIGFQSDAEQPPSRSPPPSWDPHAGGLPWPELDGQRDLKNHPSPPANFAGGLFHASSKFSTRTGKTK